MLLQQGVSPAAAAAQAGFADQPHLTRALRLIRGQTPAASLTERVGAKATTLTCLTLAAAGQLALGTTSSVTVTAAVMATSSMAFAIWTVQVRTTIQRTVPSDLLGRVISINRVLITAGSLAGAFFGGVVASRLGLRAPFLLGLPILIVAGILVAASRTTFAQTATPAGAGEPPTVR